MGRKKVIEFKINFLSQEEVDKKNTFDIIHCEKGTSINSIWQNQGNKGKNCIVVRLLYKVRAIGIKYFLQIRFMFRVYYWYLIPIYYEQIKFQPALHFLLPSGPEIWAKKALIHIHFHIKTRQLLDKNILDWKL